ncbi:unnamed protein product [Lymnaea stagnalis]|uniref:Uncharacterized protein n=1 Tax=Lymnaea stagnalis TaxID=6523 RepID=A0AAV2HUA2_LYMST
MLMAASISSIIFLAPVVLFSYSHYPLLSSNMDGYTLSLALTIMDNVSGVFKVYKYAANFIVYSLAARRFRMELVMLLTCGRCFRGATRSSIQTNQRQKN